MNIYNQPRLVLCRDGHTAAQMQRRSGGANSYKISKSSTTPTPANLKGNTAPNTPGSASRRDNLTDKVPRS